MLNLHDRLLQEKGFQEKTPTGWEPTAKADGFFRKFDTEKRSGKGVPVLQMKWASSVLAFL